MKVKQRTVCQTCRSQKLGCDGKQPECGQCNLRGRKCNWGSGLWTFMPQTIHAYGSRGKEGRVCRDLVRHRFHQEVAACEDLPAHFQHNARLPNATANQYTLVARPLCNDAIQSIIGAYVPREALPYIFQNPKGVPIMCGAWVGVLPKLTQNPQPRYVRALSLGIAALYSSVRLEPYAVVIQTYCAATNALRKDITLPKSLLDSEVVATIMCLTLVELLLPEPHFGLAMHINTVAQFFQQSGPEHFKSGVLHDLFAGIRPMFILQAFQSRTATFILSNEWIHIPFNSRHPSLMQALLSQTAYIPSLLQQTDTLLASRHEATLDQATTLCHTYLELLSVMEKWEQFLQYNYPGSMWDCSSDPGTSLPSDHCLWFPDITMANVYTHLWTFRIICAVELGRLSSLFPLTGRQYSTACNYFSSRGIQGHNESLAALICRCMEYLVQDGAKLFGPLSAMLPLQTAYKVYIADEQKNSPHVAYIKDLVERLIRKGIRSAPYMIYG